MKALMFVVVGLVGAALGACERGELQSSEQKELPADCGELPHPCENTCLTNVDGFTDEANCCDDVTCNCNPRTRIWEVYVCAN